MSPEKQLLKSSGVLNVLLLVLIIVELLVLAISLIQTDHVFVSDRAQDVIHVFTLAILFIIFYLHQAGLGRLSRRNENGERQVKAMLSMFKAVRHDLNNDMQVVLGNAELVQLLNDSGNECRKPINNIAEAAALAVERIDQLSVFGNSSKASLKAIDLNATLRETMARLSAELPAIVVLHLQLTHLQVRVMADKHLLGLSLSHLIRRTARNMQHGGDIEIRTTDVSRSDTKNDCTIVNLEIFIVRASTQSAGSFANIGGTGTDDDGLYNEFETAKALVERCGAIMVGHSVSQSGSMINMRFVSDESTMPLTQSDITLLEESIV